MSLVHTEPAIETREREDVHSATDGGSSEESASAAPPEADAPEPIRVLPPLWYRLVTGQVLWWRILRMLNRMLWWRRHAARRVLRWTDRHPEIQQLLARDGAYRLAVEQLSARRERTTRHTLGYRPLVTVHADLDITGLHGQPLVDDVHIIRDGTARPARQLTGDSLHVEITPIVPDGSASVDVSPTVLVGAIDLDTWNPRWFRRAPNRGPVALGRLCEASGDRTTRLRLETAHRARAVLCDDDGSRPAEVTAHAIAELAATGAPLAGRVSSDVAYLLGESLAGAIGAVNADTLGDAAARERHSVLLRRLAHLDFSPRGTWRRIGTASGGAASATPAVSVLLPSNRADDVVLAVRQIAAQRNVQVQLVVGLHGSRMSRDLDEQLAEAFTGDLVVRHLPDEMNLGQVLNALTEDVEGELVAKWDDDDWYDSRHLGDLVAALEYSGAAMVAKAAEFVYLESLDLTVRRFAIGSERFSTTVAGGTLLLTRRDLQEVGWADAPRRVDRLLIEALEDVGKATYRTHGFGYVLRRRGAATAQHTWQVGDSYFVGQSVDQRRGLDLAFAGVERAQP